ncbi:hypothetical protein ACFDAA_14495 [Enterococcus casseliflavus]|uniref:hypothetical protein n=1 Tax=Enterococcus casseliflavus TaxID=37734 RepID=UPI0039A58FAC
MSDKLAVLMEFNGYTKDELEAYLSLKFGSMTKGGMTASILSQSGYEKAKSVIFAQPQLNENQKALVIWMQENECYNGDPLESISDLFLEGTPSDHFPDLPLSCVEAAYQSLNNQQKVEMVQKYLEQYSEQEAE